MANFGDKIVNDDYSYFELSMPKDSNLGKENM